MRIGIFLIISILLFNCSEEKVVIEYVDRPETNTQEDISGLYMGRTVWKQFRNDGRQTGLWSDDDTFWVTKYPAYDGDSVFVVGQYPDTLHLKTFDNSVYSRVNQWKNNDEKSSWSDGERWEVKNDTLLREWFTQKLDSNGKKTRWEGVGVYPKT